MSKLEKIEREMQKTRDKIAEQQERLKELDKQRIELENLKIIQAVRAMRMTKEELATFVRSGSLPANQQPKTNQDKNPTKKQEENEND